ncbi:MAG: tape measure protein, partial [Gammaproteobacteria bacterium]|nr:tape measure protein [Gammaproteobacteria bacterium]
LRIANQSVVQAETALRATALASSELGKSSAVTARVIEQLTQAYASNTAEAQDLKTIFREIPQLSRAATKALGVHVGGWKDFAEVVRETQDLDLRTAFNRTFDVLDRTALGGDINTFAVQQERLKEGIQDIQKDIGGVLVPALTDALKVANNFVNSGAIQSIGRFFFEAAKYIVPFGVAFGTVFTIQKIRLIVRAGAFFVQLGNQIRQFATNAIARLQAFRASILRTNTATQALNNVNLSRVSGTGSRALGLLRSGFDTARNAVRGFVASLGPAGIAIVALTAAGKIWIDIIEQQRRALQLQEQVLKGYNISILSVADALKSVSETDFSALTEIQQTLNEDIREFREEIEATEGLWQRFIQGITNLSGFGANPVTGDIGANLRRRIAAQEGIENAERNLQRIQDVLNENVTIQARINALEQLRLDFQKGVEAASQNVLAAEKEFAETRKASDEANLTARKQALQLAKNQSDELDGILESLKEQLTVQERINEEQPVLPIDLSRATASIRDLEQALDTAQEGTNVELIEQTTKALVEAYSDQTLLRLRHARQTIEDEKDLQARLFELNDENIRRRISAIEESNKRRDELRREDLPLLPSLEDFRAAQQATDEYFARIEARRDVFRNLGTSAVQTFRNVRESVIGAGDTIQSIFDTLANGADALVNRFYAINGVVAQLRDVSELAFPQVTDFVGRLGNAWSGLSERQRELLPFFGRYRAAAIETVNAITGPFRSLGNAFRESDLSSILRPGVVDRGRELQEEDRVERLRELNEASEMLNRESLQRSQAIFRSAFSNIERAISSFDLSAPVIDNLKRIASAFLASTARIVLEARVSYLIQKKYDDDLTASKLANLAKVTAANTASNASILSGAAAATSTPTNVLSTAGTLASTLNPFTALLSAPLQLVINNIIGNRTIETITQESRFNRLEGL